MRRPRLHPAVPLAVALCAAAGSALAQGAAAPGPAPLAAQGCIGCHGPNGGGGGPVPALAGRPAGEIAQAMRAFGANERQGTIMGRVARGYTDAEIAAVAAHFAAIR
jgi:cytochrome subunit of sulfide dehydrogenase